MYLSKIHRKLLMFLSLDVFSLFRRFVRETFDRRKKSNGFTDSLPIGTPHACRLSARDEICISSNNNNNRITLENICCLYFLYRENIFVVDDTILAFSFYLSSSYIRILLQKKLHTRQVGRFRGRLYSTYLLLELLSRHLLFILEISS